MIKVDILIKNVKNTLADFILRQRIAKDVGSDDKGFYYSRIDGPNDE